MTPRRLIEPARLAGTSMLRTQSDARLVDLVRAGHASAFEAIVQRYRKPLLAYCSRLLPASRAEDAVQQTFLKAYQAMVSGDAELNLRPWLYRIAHNASLNLLRQNGWSHEQLDENMDGVERPDQALELRERLHSTVEAVKALPDRQRNAVLLREIDGLSYEEIALALGVGDGAVRQLLHRARATLRAGMTAVTPVGIVERVSAALAGTGGDPSSRVAELAAGAGFGAGAAKLGVAALATGVIATGAVAVPIVKHARHSRSGGVEAAAAAIPVKPAVTPASQATPVDEVNSGSSHRHAASHAERHHASSGPGSRGHGPSAKHGSPLLGRGGGGGDTQQPRQEHHSGSGDGGGDHHSGGGSGGGDDHSGGGSGGSDDGLRTPSGDGGGQHSGSDDPVGTIAPPTGTSDPTGSVIDPSGHDGGGSGGSDDGSTSGSGSDGSGSGSSSGSGS